jgi:DNA invertase Pin-like site-specific DNA recombinase
VAGVAEMERSCMVERIHAGIARARAQGKKLGRPRESSKIEASIRALRAKGHGKLKITRALNVGTATVQRILA